jgi:hypothetical protein
MRHDFYEERKEALQKWADLLDQLERGDLGDNVVPLKGSSTSTPQDREGKTAA